MKDTDLAPSETAEDKQEDNRSLSGPFSFWCLSPQVLALRSGRSYLCSLGLDFLLSPVHGLAELKCSHTWNSQKCHSSFTRIMFQPWNGMITASADHSCDSLVGEKTGICRATAFNHALHQHYQLSHMVDKQWNKPTSSKTPHNGSR